MEQVTALILHLIAGLVVGSLFGVQTLVVLALVVCAEAGAAVAVRGVSDGFIWLLVSEVALQFGYLGGMYLRSILERAGIVISVPQSEQSLKNRGL